MGRRRARASAATDYGTAGPGPPHPRPAANAGAGGDQVGVGGGCGHRAPGVTTWMTGMPNVLFHVGSDIEPDSAADGLRRCGQDDRVVAAVGEGIVDRPGESVTGDP